MSRTHRRDRPPFGDDIEDEIRHHFLEPFEWRLVRMPSASEGWCSAKDWPWRPQAWSSVLSPPSPRRAPLHNCSMKCNQTTPRHSSPLRCCSWRSPP